MTILVNGQIDPGQIEEREANEAITPGELLDVDADQEAIPHGTAGGNVQPIVALENQRLEGDDHDYEAAEDVRVYTPQPGDVLKMWLADGETVEDGDFLESDGAGALQAHSPQSVDEGGSATYTIYTNNVKFVANEDKDTSGGDATRERIEAKVIS